MKPDKPSLVWDLYLYATNTGEWYPNHVAFATRNLSLSGWFDWTFTITNHYTKQFGRIQISDNDRYCLARDLSDYYRRHNAESQNVTS